MSFQGSIGIRKTVSRFAILAVLISQTAFAVDGEEKETASEKEVAAEKDAAVERTRRTVRMLDDLYKTAVVLITKTYVEDETSVPAGAAAIALWDTMDKQGWHQARFIDATGEPYNAENVAKTDFEKKSIQRLTEKTPYIDRVVSEKGKRYLEAMTRIPVVMEKCALCHPHYSDAPKGATIGAIRYRIAIDE